MGWTDWIVSFDEGQQIYWPWEEVVEFVQQYGKLQKSPYAQQIHNLQMENPISESVSIHGSAEEGVSAISISRPTDNVYIRPFVYKALLKFNAILCDQNFTSGCAATDLSGHIPASILNDGLTIVSSANEIYR